MLDLLLQEPQILTALQKIIGSKLSVSCAVWTSLSHLFIYLCNDAVVMMIVEQQLLYCSQLERVWKEVVVASFNVIFQHFLARTEENNKHSQSAPRPRFKPGSFQTQVRSVST